ncbi:CIA30 family protein [Polychaeton citri CBS 116435]|uniref:CIA30 family protein n=1 Tax=Polychaeton citri CBS 116435 TaxID=1314669 RepID=A0A9P4Q8Z8_9PEZI|nr:CIA30 family protein [Polychaeton citri CBS 116435]
MKEGKSMLLFGGDDGWQASDWVASDDRVRGGKSQSYLDCSDEVARFHGTLDIDTLGGAGFASQRTTGDKRKWDLSRYDGITLDIAKGDKKRYTFILKDELLPPNPENGREQSTISYECDFDLPRQDRPGESDGASIFIPWSSLNATYRGKLKKDAKPLDRTSVKRMSILMRSFFGVQKGEFSISIKSISASPKAPPPDQNVAAAVVQPGELEKGLPAVPQPASTKQAPSLELWGWRSVAVLVLSCIAGYHVWHWALSYSA